MEDETETVEDIFDDVIEDLPQFMYEATHKYYNYGLQSKLDVIQTSLNFPEFSQKEIADIHHRICSYVSNVFKQFAKNNCVSINKLGRPRIIQPYMEDYFATVISCHANLILKEYAKVIEQDINTKISASTVCRQMARQNLTRKKVTKKISDRKYLEENIDYYSKYLLAISDVNAENIFAFDESRYDDWIDGCSNERYFLHHLLDIVYTQLDRGDWIILDNCRIHTTLLTPHIFNYCN